MICCGKERSWGFWVLMSILIPVGIAALIFLLGFVVMSLWNWLLPGLFGFKVITFWQAIGIFILAKLLFGGFRSCHHASHKRDKMKYWHMTNEEREKLREEWRNRCSSSDKKEE